MFMDNVGALRASVPVNLSVMPLIGVLETYGK